MSQTFQIISEAAYIPATDIQILEENTIPGTRENRLIFRAVLQEANVVNNNKRMYPPETLQKIVEQLKDKALERKLLGELDHPQPQGDTSAKMKRSSTILLQNVCILFRKLDYVDGKIYAECETINTPSGRIVRDLLNDKISFGFSLRAFGSTENRSGITVVLADDIKALTFDVVANPSHNTAVIQEFLSESEEQSAKEQLKELIQEMSEYKTSLEKEVHSEIIEESKALFDSIRDAGKEARDGMIGQVCVNGICMARPLTESIDYLIEQTMKQEAQRYRTKIKRK